MKLLLVTYEFPPFMATGGIGSYMHHVAEIMASKGNNVTVFSATQTHKEVTILEKKEYTIYLIPASDTDQFRIKVFKLFENYIQNNQVDVIESPEVGACSLLIKEAYPRIPLIVKMHSPGVLITKVSNTYQPIKTKLRYVLGAFFRGRIDLGYWSKIDLNKEKDPEYKICELADYLLSPSKALKDWAVKYWQIPERKIEIFPNPFAADENLFSFPINNRTNTICFIGKLTILKGMITFTPALKEILLRYPEYNLLIAGRDEVISKEIPSMKEWMIKQFKEVNNRVVFLGAIHKENVFDILTKSQVCVIPSLWENYPNVVLEAMAAGCTVVASNRGGIPELIEDGKTGVLFNPLKPLEIVKAIDELLRNDSKRFQFADESRKRLLTNQSSVKFTNDLDSFYRQLKNSNSIFD